jgi:hypothetical protein
LGFPAVPGAERNRLPPPERTEAPSSDARGPRTFSPFALGIAFGATTLLTVAFVIAGLVFQGTSTERGFERTRAAPITVTESAPLETPLEQRPTTKTSQELALPLASAPQRPDARESPEEWPPARAFTARCRAPGGGCSPDCTPLAGGRCLDPCFIHTAECSRDCVKPDGSCGFPPPDAE